MTAIPLVKPVITGCGMNRITDPNFATPGDVAWDLQLEQQLCG